MNRISKNITYNEATHSATATRKGIKNEPNTDQRFNMSIVAEKVFEPLRNWHGKAIGISSGYRSKALNTAIKGSKTSQHCFGQALDIDADIFDNGITNADIFNWIKDNLEFDQMIWEFGTDDEPDWVHVSYVTHRANRKKLTRAHNTKPTYRDYTG